MPFTVVRCPILPVPCPLTLLVSDSGLRGIQAHLHHICPGCAQMKGRARLADGLGTAAEDAEGSCCDRICSFGKTPAACMSPVSRVAVALQKRPKDVSHSQKRHTHLHLIRRRHCFRFLYREPLSQSEHTCIREQGSLRQPFFNAAARASF